MKKRLDVVLVERGLFPSRQKAQAAVMSGRVMVDNQKITKSGHQISPQATLSILELDNYVSRGGEKLEKGLEQFNIKVQGKKAADIGASTGGFTDCLLQNGAQKVLAIDVGYGQFSYKLRQD